MSYIIKSKAVPRKKIGNMYCPILGLFNKNGRIHDCLSDLNSITTSLEY